MRRANAKNLHQHAAPAVMLAAGGVLLSAVLLVNVSHTASVSRSVSLQGLFGPVVRVQPAANGLATIAPHSHEASLPAAAQPAAGLPDLVAMDQTVRLQMVLQTVPMPGQQ